MSTTSTPNRQQRSVEQESNLQTLMVIGTDWVRIMMFNATFNNILVISWWSVLLVGESGVPGEDLRPAQVADKVYHIMLY